MATFRTAAVGSGVQARADVGVISVQSSYTMTAALALNDVIEMVKVPAGAKILEVIAEVPSLDSSTGVVWAVGDGSAVGRFLSGQTLGRSGAGGVARLGAGITNGSATNYTYSAADTIDFTITTAATGTPASSGTIKLTVLYTLQQLVA